MTMADLSSVFARFESLGDNCEFGFVQRHFGAEPIGLFRFNWIGMQALLHGLETRFAGLEAPENLTIEHDQAGEFIVRDEVFGFYTHTGRYVGKVSHGELLQSEIGRLAYLRDKLFEDLEDGEKIFVRKGDGVESVPEAMKLYRTLRALGARRLLYVVGADEMHDPGAVEQIEEGLWCGYLSRFAPYGYAREFLPDEWAQVCTNALTMITAASPVPALTA